MGQTKKAKVMFTCEWETKDFLTKWANAENRTLSNLVETLITEAIATKQAQQSETPAPEPSTGSKGKGK